MRLFNWLWRAALFFVLFAFALNNQHVVEVRWFLGHEWRAPMVYVVLIVFTLGCATGALAMLPSWWRHRRGARQRDLLMPDPLINAGPTPSSGVASSTETGNTEAIELPHPPDMPAPRKPAR